MAPRRPTVPLNSIPEPLYARPGFLIAWLAEQLTERYETSMAALGLRPATHAILAVLDAEGEIRQARLEARLRLDHASFVAAVGELTRLGALRRRADATDARALLVSLTAEGKALLEAAMAATMELEEDALRSLPAEHREQLVARLADLARGMR